MFDSISAAIARHYSPRLTGVLLLASAGFLGLFSFSASPLSNAEMTRISGGEGFLDVKPFYSAQEAFAALGRYGTEGRELYQRFLIADFAFPLAYGLGLAFLLTRTARAAWGIGTPWLRLNLLPLGIALFDYVENLCTLGMLNVYPGTSLTLGSLAGIATLSKHLLTFATFLCLAFGGLSLLVRRLGHED